MFSAKASGVRASSKRCDTRSSRSTWPDRARDRARVGVLHPPGHADGEPLAARGAVREIQSVVAGDADEHEAPAGAHDVRGVLHRRVRPCRLEDDVQVGCLRTGRHRHPRKPASRRRRRARSPWRRATDACPTPGSVTRPTASRAGRGAVRPGRSRSRRRRRRRAGVRGRPHARRRPASRAARPPARSSRPARESNSALRLISSRRAPSSGQTP